MKPNKNGQIGKDKLGSKWNMEQWAFQIYGQKIPMYLFCGKSIFLNLSHVFINPLGGFQ
jgi:hypothetical protein